MRFIITLIILSIFGSCREPSPDQTQDAMDSTSIYQQAQKLAHQFIITDGHIDLPYRLNEKMEDVSVRTSGGDFDYVRAVEGGLNAPFMSIYVPASYQQTGGAREFADSMINLVESLTVEHPDKFALANNPEEVRELVAEGKIALPMGMENGAPLLDDLENVQYFYDRGIRYITLTHSKNNLICDSSYDSTRTWNGLSPFGHKVVAEMNKVGIMVDISHVSDSAFYQVMAVTKAPAIASHSSCRHFTPGWERNMSDDMIKALAANGGVIQINFGSSFLDAKSKESSDRIDDHVASWRADQAQDPGDSASDAYQNQYHREHYIFSTVQRVADHIDHVVSIAGIDHVGLGSDFDGVGNSLPQGIKDVSQYPNLIGELLKRGYTEEEIEKICSGNVFRVWERVAEVAAALQTEG